MKASFKKEKSTLAIHALFKRSHYISLGIMVENLVSDIERLLNGEGTIKETIKKDTPVIEVVEILSYYIVSPTFEDFENLMNVELIND